MSDILFTNCNIMDGSLRWVTVSAAVKSIMSVNTAKEASGNTIAAAEY